MKGKFTVGTVATPPPPPAPTKLAASIGPGSTSSLRPLAGLSAGAFAIAVSDRSSSDGFRLSGPGVAKATGTGFRGTATWRIRLAAGRYSFGSALHSKLRHSFTIGK
jgi:hypothetical protein